MSDGVLFHAYVVSGARAVARAHIASLLESFAVPQTEGPDFAITEQINFTIDHARTLRTWQELSPQGERKVHVVYADFITHEAQNALLKLLEEPTPRTHIIFAIPKPDILLPTLLSRVRVLIPGSSVGQRVSRIWGDISAESFVQMSKPERVALVGKLVEKSESDEASAEVREKAVAFVEALEQFLAADVYKNQQTLSRLIAFKKYLYTSGASVKMILETIALTI